MNTVLCLFKVNSNTIELTVNPSNYYILDILLLTDDKTAQNGFIVENLIKNWIGVTDLESCIQEKC